MEFQVWPAYPNPFNPRTTIPFSIPMTQKITLTIFDALGREVVTLIDDTLSVGRHFVQWQAENMPSGLYFYRLSSNSNSATNKMILLK
jgi:hypothetical protein